MCILYLSLLRLRVIISGVLVIDFGKPGIHKVYVLKSLNRSIILRIVYIKYCGGHPRLLHKVSVSIIIKTSLYLLLRFTPFICNIYRSTVQNSSLLRGVKKVEDSRKTKP